jgi:hypothetical protein
MWLKYRPRELATQLDEIIRNPPKFRETLLSFGETPKDVIYHVYSELSRFSFNKFRGHNMHLAVVDLAIARYFRTRGSQVSVSQPKKFEALSRELVMVFVEDTNPLAKALRLSSIHDRLKMDVKGDMSKELIISFLAAANPPAFASNYVFLFDFLGRGIEEFSLISNSPADIRKAFTFIGPLNDIASEAGVPLWTIARHFLIQKEAELVGVSNDALVKALAGEQIERIRAEKGKHKFDHVDVVLPDGDGRAALVLDLEFGRSSFTEKG